MTLSTAARDAIDRALSLAAAETTMAVAALHADDDRATTLRQVAAALDAHARDIGSLIATDLGEDRRLQFRQPSRALAGILAASALGPPVIALTAPAAWAAKRPVIMLPPNPGGDNHDDGDAAPPPVTDEDTTEPEAALPVPAPPTPPVPVPAPPPAPAPASAQPEAPPVPAAEPSPTTDAVEPAAGETPPAPAPPSEPDPTLGEVPASVPAAPLPAETQPPAPHIPDPAPPSSGEREDEPVSSESLVLEHLTIVKRNTSPHLHRRVVWQVQPTKPAAHASRAIAIAHSPSVPVRARALETHLVSHGESLWSIARERLPASATPTRIAIATTQLWTRNAERIGTGDPDLLPVGTPLVIPSTINKEHA